MKPNPPPLPRPYVMKESPTVRMTQEERQTICDAMPDGLTIWQQSLLFEHCQEMISTCIGLGGQSLGKATNGAEIGLLVGEIESLLGDLDRGGRRIDPSESVRRWAMTFCGPRASDEMDNSTRNLRRAKFVLKKTAKELTCLPSNPGRPSNYALLISGCIFAEAWIGFAGATSYRYLDNHGPFSLMIQAIGRIALGRPTYDGAADALAIHKAISIRKAHDKP